MTIGLRVPTITLDAHARGWLLSLPRLVMLYLLMTSAAFTFSWARVLFNLRSTEYAVALKSFRCRFAFDKRLMFH